MVTKPRLTLMSYIGKTVMSIHIHIHIHAYIQILIIDMIDCSIGSIVQYTLFGKNWSIM